MDADVELIERIYDRFNARDIDAVLASLADDVVWANGIDGGHIHGRGAVREYWTRQWATIQPRVDPLKVARRGDGAAAVEVHQVVRDLEGELLLDETSATSSGLRAA